MNPYISSELSQSVLRDGEGFWVETFRAAWDSRWSVEIVGEDGTAHEWRRDFNGEAEALDAALSAIRDPRWPRVAGTRRLPAP